MTTSPGMTGTLPQAIGRLSEPPRSRSRVVIEETPRHQTGNIALDQFMRVGARAIEHGPHGPRDFERKTDATAESRRGGRRPAGR